MTSNIPETSNLPIKFSKEVSNFIEANGTKSDNYYWLPQYFKKVGEGLFEITHFKDLPTEFKHIVEESLPKSGEDFK